MAEIIPDADFEDLDTALSAEDVAAAGVTLPAGRTAAQIDGVYKATKDGEEIGYLGQLTTRSRRKKTCVSPHTSQRSI